MPSNFDKIPIKTDKQLDQLKRHNDYKLHEALAIAKVWLVKVAGILLALFAILLILSACMLIARYIYLIWGDTQEIKNIIMNCASALFGAVMTLAASRKK